MGLILDVDKVLKYMNALIKAELISFSILKPYFSVTYLLNEQAVSKHNAVLLRSIFYFHCSNMQRYDQAYHATMPSQKT